MSVPAFEPLSLDAIRELRLERILAAFPGDDDLKGLSIGEVALAQMERTA